MTTCSRLRALCALLTPLALLVACTVNAPSGQQDSAPLLSMEADKILDATPRHDPITRAGNKNPYTLFDKTYHLLPTSVGYSERGVASWYGAKFQGRPTANGERYNLYAMTAAHKTLPIPAYVKVTNLANQRTVIVRVNDRGPFHGGRIIDLSYAAAVKLGYVDQGTAQVLVEAIDTRKVLPISKRPVSTGQASSVNSAVAKADKDAVPNSAEYTVQVAAFKQFELAEKLRSELASQFSEKVFISASEPAGFYRVQLGPIASLAKAQQLRDKLQKLQLGTPQIKAQSLAVTR